MARTPPKLKPILGMKGFYIMQKGNLACTVIQLRSGDFCLHSPVSGLSGPIKSSLESLGSVKFILAPNHYHNKGLVEFADAFPTATLTASEESRARLEKVTGLNFEGLGELQKAMPTGVQIVRAQGLKTGEVWVFTEKGLLVVDAFAGPSNGGTSPALLKTFPRYGVKDRETYVSWMNDFFDAHSPEILIPCHGDIITDAKLTPKLLTLVNEGL